MAHGKYLVKAQMKTGNASRIALRDTMKEARKVANSLDKVAFSRIEIYKICEVYYSEDDIPLPEDKTITIKDIKEKYRHYQVKKGCEKNSFRTAEFKKHGKVVIIVKRDTEKNVRQLTQIVRVEDGKELLQGCDLPVLNLGDAVTVAENALKNKKYIAKEAE